MIAQIIELVILLLGTIALVIYYSDSQVKLYVKILVTISWMTSFLIILILPVDINYTLKGEQLYTVKKVWEAIYYVNFIFTWLLLPIVQHYESAGQFTWKGRLKRSLINNGIMIAVFLVVGIMLVIYLAIAGTFSIDLLPAIFATIANLFGIILVIIFLGHGLISLPKHFYLKSSNTKSLTHNYRTASLINHKLQDLDFEIDVELRKVYHLQNSTDTLISTLASRILEEIPENIRSKTNIKSKPFDLLDAQTATQKKMIELSQQVKKKIGEYQMYNSWLQEIVDDTKFINSQTKKNNYLYLKITYISLLVITIFISTVIFIGEISSFVPVFQKANILIYIDQAKSAVSYILNSLLLIYMTYIITHSIFEMNVFGLFNLHKRHSTSVSLLFMSINVARISYPLCYNYLQITGMPEIAFLEFFGEIQIGGKNAYIFPILLIIFGVFNLLSIYDRVMACLGLGRYAFSEQEDSNDQGGKRIIQKLIEKQQDISDRLSQISQKSKSGGYLQLGKF